MKSIYHFLVAAVAMLGVSFSAGAANATATLQWDNPGALKVSLVAGGNTTALDIPADATTYTVSHDAGAAPYLLVEAAAGFQLESCRYYYPALEMYRTVSGGWNKPYTFKIYFSQEAYNGMTYEIATTKVQKDASFTIYIENGASDIAEIRLNGTGEKITPAPGISHYDFASTVDKTITLSEKTIYPFYYVKLNGDIVNKEKDYNTFYTLPIADGDVITIRVHEHDSEANQLSYTLNLSGKAAEAIQSIFNRTQLNTIWSDGISDGMTYTCAAGDKININFKEGYDNISVKVNGVAVEGSGSTTGSGYTASFTATAGGTISISAADKQYAMQKYTFYIANPELITLHAGTYMEGKGGYDIDLTQYTAEPVSEDIKMLAENGSVAYVMPAGKTVKYTIEVSEKLGQVIISYNKGAWIPAVRNGDLRTHDCNMCVSGKGGAGETVWIAAKPYEPTDKALVYFEGDTNRIKMKPDNSYEAYFALGFRNPENIGYTEFAFEAAYESPYTLGWNGEIPVNDMIVFINGKAVDKSDDDTFILNLHNGDMLKIIADEKVHASKLITFADGDDAKWQGTEFVYDRIIKHTDFAGEIIHYKGTEIVAKAPAGYVLTFNDEYLAPDQDGYTRFTTANKNYEVALKKDTRACTITPADDLSYIDLVFPDAAAVKIADMYAGDGLNQGMTLTTTDGNWANIRYQVSPIDYNGDGLVNAQDKPYGYRVIFTPAPTRYTDYNFMVVEGFFEIDGMVNEDIKAKFSLNGTTSFEFKQDPYLVVADWEANYQYGLGLTLVFGEQFQPKAVKDVINTAACTFNGAALSAFKFFGCEQNYVMFEITAKPEGFNDGGEIVLNVPAGSFTINGEANPAITAKWTAKKPGTYTAASHTDTDVEQESLATVHFTFDGAEEISFWPYGVITLSTADRKYDGTDYNVRATAENIVIGEPSRGTSPVISVTFDPAPANGGDYLLDVSYGAFYLDGFASPAFTQIYKLKDQTGIQAVGVDGDAAAAPVYNLQGMRMSAEWNALPAGIYLREGRKVIKH